MQNVQNFMIFQERNGKAKQMLIVKGDDASSEKLNSILSEQEQTVGFFDNVYNMAKIKKDEFLTSNNFCTFDNIVGMAFEKPEYYIEYHIKNILKEYKPNLDPDLFLKSINVLLESKFSKLPLDEFRKKYQ